MTNDGAAPANETMVHARAQTGPVVEIRTGASPARQVAVNSRLIVGREDVDLVLDDPSISRRHLALEPDPHGPGLIVTDLGSRNGTKHNGVVLRGPTPFGPHDRVELGDTVITLASVLAQGETAVTSSGVRVEARPGTPAARVQRAVEARAERAWRRLAGLLPEGVRLAPVIRLVDPFPDPADPKRAVASGSVIDEERGEIWSVATAEVAPDDPGRTLALLVAAHLPAGEDISVLVEGYGLHVAGAPDPDDALRTLGPLPPSRATGEARTLGALSFVRFLLAREPEDNLRALLRDTRPGALEAELTRVFGRGLGALEQAWLNHLGATASGDVKPRQFLRLAVRYLRPYRAKQAEIFVYMVFGLTFSIVLPFVSRRLFDDALPSGEFSRVLELLAVLGGAFALSLLAGVRQAWCTALVSGFVIRDLREQLFARVQRLPLSWFGRYNQGEVLSRLFSDVRSVEGGLSQVIGLGISQGLALLVSTVIMFTVHPLLGLIVSVAVPIVAIIYRQMSAGALARSLIVQEENSALLSVAAENYSAQPVVKLFGLHARERARFGGAGGRVLRAERRVTMFGGLFSLAVNSVITSLRLVVLGVGSWLILHDRLTVGGLVAFLGVMGEVISPATSLTQLGQSIQRSGGSLVRINEVLEAVTEDDDPGRAPLPLLSREIQLRDVTFAYQEGTDPAVQGIRCTIPAGRRVAFVGPSGSGKSTILRLLMRLDEPSSGAITFDGVPLTERSLVSLRAQLGVVLQESFLFDASLRENIALGHVATANGAGAADVTEEEIEAAAKAAEIDEFVRSLPRGYDTAVGERGGRLSGGQRQRVSIARALVRNPQVLLLDEATSALDPATERQINSTLERVGMGRTTVAITHRLTSIMDFDRIFVIDRGRLVEEGTHTELVALAGTYAHLWAEQTGEVVAESEPGFDARAALRGISIFASISDAALDDVASHLSKLSLRDGEQVTEGDGDLWIVTSGRGAVLVAPGAGAAVAQDSRALAAATTAEVGPGDVFGLSALLGDAQGRRLRAAGGMQLLQLRGGSLTILAARQPEISLVPPRAEAPESRPRGGTRVMAIPSATLHRAALAAAPASTLGASR